MMHCFNISPPFFVVSIGNGVSGVVNMLATIPVFFYVGFTSREKRGGV